MVETKHTPGPWQVDQGDEEALRVVKGALPICELIPLDAHNRRDSTWLITGAETLANAHLIAAAPGLLSACVEAEEVIVTTLKDLLRYAGMPEKDAEEHPTVQKLRAAIAKAEGREP